VVRDALPASKLKFWPNAETDVAALLKAEHDLRSESDGSVSCDVDGVRVPVVEAVKAVVARRPHLVEQSTDYYKPAQPQKGRDEMSKSEQMDYLERNGLKAYE
jgi:hypothetical protein